MVAVPVLEIFGDELSNTSRPSSQSRNGFSSKQSLTFNGICGDEDLVNREEDGIPHLHILIDQFHQQDGSQHQMEH